MIKNITLTGADDLNEPLDLVEICDKYPNAEFGILISKNKSGPRYPTEDWILELFNVWKKATNLNLSLHVCGKYVRDICNGNWSFFENSILKETFKMFKRVQLNFSPYVDSINLDKFSNGLKIKELENKQIIFQLKKIDSLIYSSLKDKFNVVPLFDLSGGRGILPTEWPKSTAYTGYAGGLNPNNVKESCAKIFSVAEGNFWIDAETGLRTKNEKCDFFDINKVNLFLERVLECSNLVGQ